MKVVPRPLHDEVLAEVLTPVRELRLAMDSGCGSLLGRRNGPDNDRDVGPSPEAEVTRVVIPSPNKGCD